MLSWLQSGGRCEVSSVAAFLFICGASAGAGAVRSKYKRHESIDNDYHQGPLFKGQRCLCGLIVLCTEPRHEILLRLFALVALMLERSVSFPRRPPLKHTTGSVPRLHSVACHNRIPTAPTGIAVPCCTSSLTDRYIKSHKSLERPADATM